MFVATNVDHEILSPREVAVYRNLFNEELNRLIPKMLFDIWNDAHFVLHQLPQSCGHILELFGGVNALGEPQSVTHIDIGEYADYRNLPALDPAIITSEIRLLALGAAESYTWNVRNAFLKGGRLMAKVNQQRLHLTDWENEFHVNVVGALPDLCPGDESKFKGWVAYRYRFVAVKL